MQCLTLLLSLQTPGRGIKKSLRLCSIPPPSSPSSAAQPGITESQMNAIHLDPSQNVNQPETGPPRAGVHLHGLGWGGGCNCISFSCTRQGCSLHRGEAAPEPQYSAPYCRWQAWSGRGLGDLCLGSQGLLEKLLNSNDSDTKISCTAF